MKGRSLILLAVWAAGMAGGFAADRLLFAQQESVKRTMLLEKDLAELPGKETNVFLIEMAPGAATGRHSHPGSEIAYILEGTASVETGGNAVPVVQRRGTVSYLKPDEVHNVSNQSSSEPLKAIVFAIYDKGKPKITTAK